MPELPEVETTRRGVLPHVLGHSFTRITVRQPSLRWPVAPELKKLRGHSVRDLRRRGKYLLWDFDSGTLLVHLGMSGSLRLVEPAAPLRTHDHILVDLDNGLQLRYHDPRRFGAWLWAGHCPAEHPLLRKLGPEPLQDDFDGGHLHRAARGRNTSIKQFIMDATVVVGVGNIYACEALFLAGIDPRRPASRISAARLNKLTDAIRTVLEASIRQGGTTLRDYLNQDGEPGYFKQQLRVYDREGEACRVCGTAIKRIIQGGRSTFYCPRCQR